MGTITVNVDDDIELLFRETVKEELGEAKGTLGTAIQEALASWIENKREQEIAERQQVLMEKGFSLGKFKFVREELHERGA